MFNLILWIDISITSYEIIPACVPINPIDDESTMVQIIFGTIRQRAIEPILTQIYVIIRRH